MIRLGAELDWPSGSKARGLGDRLCCYHFTFWGMRRTKDSMVSY